MKVKYLGPSDAVNVGGYGSHRKGEVKHYPDEFAEELLVTSKKQKFKAVPATKSGGKPATQKAGK